MVFHSDARRCLAGGPDTLLRKRLALDKVSQAEIASVLVAIPVMLGMAWAGHEVWALVVGALMMRLIQSVVTIWFVRVTALAQRQIRGGLSQGVCVGNGGTTIHRNLSQLLQQPAPPFES